MADTDIKEGLLCPICMKDLGTVSLLQAHFDEVHTSEDKAVVNQLKDLFGRAKKRLLKAIDDDSDDEEVRLVAATPANSVNVQGYDPTLWEPQEFGMSRSHTDTFKGIRDVRTDRHVIETNKIIIRLNKLISDDAPLEGNKRKAYEKSIVPWVRDRDVTQCRQCGRVFSLVRRRHHCRLCGEIMCDRCSQFLPFFYAKKLVNPSFVVETEQGFLQRADSNSSLNSMMSPEGEPHLRTCSECRKLLERRDQLMELRNTKAPIVLLYEKMKECVTTAERLLTTYLPMAESLLLGEATYEMFEAQTIRIQLTKLFEAIDLLSKKILTLNVESDPPPSQRQLKLQKTIRLFASSFLQDNLMGLQSLPSEAEYENLKKSHQLKVKRAIATERLNLLEAQEHEKKIFKPEHLRKSSQPLAILSDNEKVALQRRNSSSSFNDRDDSQIGLGWKPVVTKSARSSADDPMIQQMDIIRSYISQARDAQRFDEVTMLEQNLHDLQTEYYQQSTNS